jgi:5-methylcytosine-specific restriction protein A
MPFGGHALAGFIRHQGAEAVAEAMGPEGKGLKTVGSAGAGNWAVAPWIAVFDPLVTESATQGHYVVYLFNAKASTVHLSLNQGTTEVREEFGSDARTVLKQRAKFMRDRLADYAPLLPVTSIEMGSDARLPGDYAAGHSMGFTYQLDGMPSEGKLQEDLLSAVRAYRALTFRGGVNEVSEAGSADDEGLSPAASLIEIRRYRHHKRIERNPGAAKAAKKHHGTRCQVCEMDFGERYGTLGQGFIEAHHLKPISQLEEGVPVEFDVATDFAVLCSNCHRMVHKMDNPSDINALRDRIDQTAQVRRARAQ